MSTPAPDTITVSVLEEREIAATHADLWVVVQGSSLVTGNAALNKAREVSQLVADLQGAGVSEADIHLEGVRAETASGMMARSSSAAYTLRIRCRDLPRLADVLGAITTQKNAALRLTQWGYSDEDSRRDALLDECLRLVGDKARRIASGLGVTLTGVHRFTETFQDEDDPTSVARSSFGRARARRIGEVKSMTPEDLGMEVSHSKLIALRIDVEYLVSGFTVPDASGTP